MDRNSSLFISFQCILHDSGVLFSGFSNFCNLKRGDLIPGGNQFCGMSKLSDTPSSLFESQKFYGPKFFVVDCISMYCAWYRSTSLSVYKFVQIKEGRPNFWGGPILQNVWIIWSPLLYFSLKSSMDPHTFSFVRFQSILHESGRLFSESWNFSKLKRRDLIFGGHQFWRMSELFGPSFCISIL